MTSEAYMKRLTANNAMMMMLPRGDWLLPERRSSTYCKQTSSIADRLHICQAACDVTTLLKPHQAANIDSGSRV